MQAVGNVSRTAQSSANGPHVALFDVNSVMRDACTAAAEGGQLNTTSSCVTYNDPFDLLVRSPW